MPTTNAGSTIVRNTSGEDGKYFDFLGPRGATLDDGEDAAIPGDVLTMWYKNPQKLAALNYALQNNLIEILQTPAVLCFDPTDEKVLAIGVDEGEPVAIPADYGSYDGDPPDV